MKKEKRKLKRFFVAPKGEKVSYKSLIRVTLSSIIGVLLCGFFLAGLSWAWVTDGVTSAKNIIKPVNYDIIVNITDGNGEEVLAESGKSYLLSAGQRYTVVLTATGEASTGYCKVTLNGDVYYTTQIIPSASVEFTVDCSSVSGDVSISFVPNWMTYSGYSETASDLIGQTVSLLVPKDISDGNDTGEIYSDTENETADTGNEEMNENSEENSLSNSDETETPNDIPLEGGQVSSAVGDSGTQSGQPDSGTSSGGDISDIQTSDETVTQDNGAADSGADSASDPNAVQSPNNGDSASGTAFDGSDTASSQGEGISSSASSDNGTNGTGVVSE